MSKCIVGAVATAAAAAAVSGLAVAPASASRAASPVPQAAGVSLRDAAHPPKGPGSRLWLSRYPANGYGAALVAAGPGGRRVFVTGGSGAGVLAKYATVAYDAVTGQQLWARRLNVRGYACALAAGPHGGKVFVSGTGNTTLAYDTATGARLWARRYNSPGNGGDAARSVAVSPTRDTVFVTGFSDGTNGNPGPDFATFAYRG
jgi:PQQ-like domain